jgi:hypothetical protein
MTVCTVAILRWKLLRTIVPLAHSERFGQLPAEGNRMVAAGDLSGNGRPGLS